MPLSDVQKRALKNVFGETAGEARIEQIESAGDKAKSLIEAGVNYKAQFGDFADLGKDVHEKSTHNDGADDILTAVLETQGDFATALKSFEAGLAQRDGALEDAIAKFNAAVEALNASRKAYDDKVAELESMQPRSVTQKQSAADVDEAEAARVKKENDRAVDPKLAFFGINGKQES